MVEILIPPYAPRNNGDDIPSSTPCNNGDIVLSLCCSQCSDMQILSSISFPSTPSPSLLSSSNLSSDLPFSFPFCAPRTPASDFVSYSSGRGHSCSAVGPKRSGFMSVIERAMDEEEYRRARAEVQKKGVDVEGYFFEGISVGGHETCVVVPSLNAAFDIGRCPARAVSQDFLFITHAHLDHIVSFLAPFLHHRSPLQLILKFHVANSRVTCI
ncbi:hypothetical protein KFK09_016649 [Dendrobium nobile]|uniref:Metallo-beta-lactamase domain-containing protein n=1 Tax=Dendrobium nobile TaxID=94219 RepID=A0A8T3B066_DENNO|nr:hypothetical protein KFK09_016649 [Dendrobium nobile]